MLRFAYDIVLLAKKDEELENIFNRVVRPD